MVWRRWRFEGVGRKGMGEVGGGGEWVAEDRSGSLDVSARVEVTATTTKFYSRDLERSVRDAHTFRA